MIVETEFSTKEVGPYFAEEARATLTYFLLVHADHVV